MKVNDYDVDLIACMALNEVLRSGSEGINMDDATSKLNIHARKLKESNGGIIIKV